MNFKMIVLDLDGTLLEDKINKVTDSTKEYLKNLKMNGVIITIATGRGLMSSLKATDSAEFASFICSDSGAILYDVDRNKIIEKKFLDEEENEKIIKYGIKENCDNMTVYCLENTFQYYNRGTKREEYFQIDENTNIRELIKNPTHIYMNFENEFKVKQFVNKYENEFEKIKVECLKDSAQNKNWVEITNKDVNKMKSIKKICEICNIDIEDTVAFGDSRNDIEIIKGCKIGVAMKNSQDDIIKIANYVTQNTNNEKGVELWLKNWK